MREEIRKHLAAFDLDVRKSHDAEFVDQKCAPDLVSFIADCAENLAATKPRFTIKDLWYSQYFIENMRNKYNKPWADDDKARNEYNKVLSHPLKLLAYARVLHVEKVGRALHFSVENPGLLEYIAKNMFNAYEFLYCYFEKVMADSGFTRHFEEYRRICKEDPNGIKAARDAIYEKYRMLISGNTGTSKPLNIRRMFHKVFNVYAAEHGIPGSSGKIVYKTSLMYNQVNVRDVNKAKTETRRAAALLAPKAAQNGGIHKREMGKAIATLRHIQRVSEVADLWGNGGATQVHHIFPKSEFPQFAHYMENLILLTPTQHDTKAHPDNKTQIVDKAYQITCLIAKSRTIEKSIAHNGELHYSKQRFLEILNLCLNLQLPPDSSFDAIRSALNNAYPTT